MLNIIPITTIALASILAAGAQAERTDEAINADQFCKLEDLLGAKVQLQPSAEALREAVEDGEKADRPNGEIDDLLVHTQSGDLEWAILSCGGLLGIGEKTVAVPVQSLRWNDKQECFEIAATKKELEALPSFDLSEAKKKGLDASVRVVQASWSSIAPESEKPMKQKQAKIEHEPIVYEQLTLVSFPTNLVPASELTDLPVYAQGEEFGDVECCIVDRSKHKIAFAVVSHGGIAGMGDDQYLVPFDALKACHVKDDTAKKVLTIDRTKAALKGSPKFVEPEDGVITHDQVLRAHATFKN